MKKRRNRKPMVGRFTEEEFDRVQKKFFTKRNQDRLFKTFKTINAVVLHNRKLTLIIARFKKGVNDQAWSFTPEDSAKAERKTNAAEKALYTFMKNNTK